MNNSEKTCYYSPRVTARALHKAYIEKYGDYPEGGLSDNKDIEWAMLSCRMDSVMDELRRKQIKRRILTMGTAKTNNNRRYKQKKHMVRVYVEIPEEEAIPFKEACRAKGESQAMVLKCAMSEYIDNYETEQAIKNYPIAYTKELTL